MLSHDLIWTWYYNFACLFYTSDFNFPCFFPSRITKGSDTGVSAFIFSNIIFGNFSILGVTVKA